MGLTHILETSVCLELIRSRPAVILARLQQQVPGTIGISSISVSELAMRVEKSSNPAKNRAALEHFLFPLEILDFDLPAAFQHGRIRSEFDRQNVAHRDIELLVAAHAISSNATLVVNHPAPWGLITGLRWEMWS